MKKFLTVVIALTVILSVFMFSCKNDPPEEKFDAPKKVIVIFFTDINILWTEVTDAVSYRIYVKDTTGNFTKEIPVSKNECNFTDETTLNDITYYSLTRYLINYTDSAIDIPTTQDFGVCAISQNNIYSPITWSKFRE